MIDCNSLACKCEMPIRFDSYSGCSHACKYCFVRKYSDLDKISAYKCVSELRNFIAGKRNVNTKWCDWNIPLHWGGVSDPFQKLERAKRISFECLKVFAETEYPFVVSTKGTVLTDPDYLALLRQCNAVVQISMISPKYDAIEPGAPTYAERLKIIPTLVANCKRVNVRYQPYMREVFKDAVGRLKDLKAAGVHGVIVEGLVAGKKRPGMIPTGGGKYVYTPDALIDDFLAIKNECHRLGLVFYCADDALRELGDFTCCCGTEGLEGFKTNSFTASNIALGLKVEPPTEKMKEIGTARCFRNRESTDEIRLRNSSFFEETRRFAQKMMQL